MLTKEDYMKLPKERLAELLVGVMRQRMPVVYTLEEFILWGSLNIDEYLFVKDGNPYINWGDFVDNLKEHFKDIKLTIEKEE